MVDEPEWVIAARWLSAGIPVPRERVEVWLSDFIHANAPDQATYDAAMKRLRALSVIVQALADADPCWQNEAEMYHACVLCHAKLPVTASDHNKTCAWRRAKETRVNDSEPG